MNIIRCMFYRPRKRLACTELLQQTWRLIEMTVEAIATIIFYCNVLDRAKNYGQAIGRLHKALSEWKYGNDPEKVDIIGQIQNCILKTSKSRTDQLERKRITSIAEKCMRELEYSQHLLTSQWIHRDIHAGNMLLISGKLTGIIDFDLLQKAYRIFDPCYCANSILISGWADKKKRERWKLRRDVR